jgi:hypothetical protein
MLTNPTVEKLHTLRLAGMATALSEQLGQPDHYDELQFTDRLGLIVDREAQDRDNRRLVRNLKTAGYAPMPASRTSTSAGPEAWTAPKSCNSRTPGGSPTAKTWSSSAPPAPAKRS